MDLDSFMTIYDHISTRELARLGILADQPSLTFRTPFYTKNYRSNQGQTVYKPGVYTTRSVFVTFYTGGGLKASSSLW